MSTAIQPIPFRPAKFKRKLRLWQPQWKPEYEAIVAESCLGKANTVLAEKYKFTEQHISNILNTEEARKIKQEAISAIRKNSMNLMATKMANMTDKALDNIEKVICDPATQEKIDSPLAIFDKSLAYLKGVGKLAGDGSTIINDNSTKNVQQNTFLNMSDEQAAIFTKGVDKALAAVEKFKDIKGESIN
jgi:hypothetical protein